MIVAEPIRAPRSRRPPPQPDEQMGWGALALVAGCVLAGAVLLFLFRGWVWGSTPGDPTAPPPPAAAVPAGGGATGASPPSPGDRPPPPPAAGEGHVVLTPQEGLRVLGAKPQAMSVVFPHASIEIAFSAAMDEASLKTALEITPKLDGTMEWPRRDQMIFRPREPLPMGTQYTVVVTGYARSLNRLDYLQPHEWSFRVHEAYTFRQNVGRVIRHGCGTCHSPGRAAARVPLLTYDQVKTYVQKGNSAASPLYASLSDPRNHSQIADDWRAMTYVIRDWIDKFAAAE